jgi:hypothetical protein
MKATLTFLAYLICILCFGQNNLFSTGDFGMRYGVGYSGAVTQQIRLSGIVAKNIEFGAGLTFSYSADKNTSLDSTDVQTYSGSEKASEVDVNKIKTFSLAITPFVAYHFPLKSNVDLYAGVFGNFGTAITFDDVDIFTTAAANYEDMRTTTDFEPGSLYAGGGVLAGFQYFFFKRFAIGAEASVGTRNIFSFGKQGQKIVDSNTGSQNPDPSSSSEQFIVHYSNSSFNLSAAGNVSICLTMYLGKSPLKNKIEATSSNP